MPKAKEQGEVYHEAWKYRVGPVTAPFCPGLSRATDEKNIEVKTTQNLVNLCTTASDEALFPQTINFCHGYLVGAYHFYAVQASGTDGYEMVCMPDPPPTRNEAIAMFVELAQAHPESGKEG